MKDVSGNSDGNYIIMVKATAMLKLTLMKIAMTMVMASAMLALHPNAKVISKGLPAFE